MPKNIKEFRIVTLNILCHKEDALFIREEMDANINMNIHNLISSSDKALTGHGRTSHNFYSLGTFIRKPSPDEAKHIKSLYPN